MMTTTTIGLWSSKTTALTLWSTNKLRDFRKNIHNSHSHPPQSTEKLFEQKELVLTSGFEPLTARVTGKNLTNWTIEPLSQLGITLWQWNSDFTVTQQVISKSNSSMLWMLWNHLKESNGQACVQIPEDFFLYLLSQFHLRSAVQSNNSTKSIRVTKFSKFNQ